MKFQTKSKHYKRQTSFLTNNLKVESQIDFKIVYIRFNSYLPMHLTTFLDPVVHL